LSNASEGIEAHSWGERLDVEASSRDTRRGAARVHRGSIIGLQYVLATSDPEGTLAASIFGGTHDEENRSALAACERPRRPAPTTPSFSLIAVDQ